MATQSPFSFLQGLFERASVVAQPPQWLVHEVQQRVVLLLNHVLMQEPEAMRRLVAQRGRVARVQWRQYVFALVITPAGLFNLAPQGAEADLHIEVSEPSALALAQAALRGDKPTIRIQGDVQLAGDIQWLADHVRWDIEEDLARLVGDGPAHALASMARRVVQALASFVTPLARERAGAPGTGLGGPDRTSS